MKKNSVTPPKALKERERDDAMYSGALMVLGVVYNFEPDPTATLTQEIVASFRTDELVRVAIKEDDCYLPLLRQTIRSLRRPRSRRRADRQKASSGMSPTEAFTEGQKVQKILKERQK